MKGKIVYMLAAFAAVFSPAFGTGITHRNPQGPSAAPLFLQMYKAGNPLWKVHEAAVLDYQGRFSYADTWVGGRMSAGDFRRPQQPQSRYDILFNAEVRRRSAVSF